jgi:hypothetical protein
MLIALIAHVMLRRLMTVAKALAHAATQAQLQRALFMRDAQGQAYHSTLPHHRRRPSRTTASSTSSNFGAKTWETGRNDVVISTGGTHIASHHHVRVLSVRYIQTLSSVIPALPTRVWGFQNSRSAS